MLFVSENIFELNSGTEFSQARHVQLLNKHQTPSLYVTRNYSPYLQRAARTLGLTGKDNLNMYDYFQEISSVRYHEERQLSLRLADEIVKKDYHIEGIDPNYSLIKYHGKTVGRINVIPGSVGTIGTIIWYDSFGNKAVEEQYDVRGFKSSMSYYHPGGQLGPVILLGRDGQPKIEITRMNLNGNVLPTQYKLLDYNGGVYRFATEDQLFTFFLEEIIKAHPEQADIVMERPTLIDAVARVKNSHSRWAVLHDAHADNNRDQVKSKMKPGFALLFNPLYAASLDGYLVATEAQRSDLLQRYPKATIKVISDTFVSRQDLYKKARVQEKDRKNKHQILVLGRVSPERQPEDALRVLALVKKAIPDATLKFQGYLADESLRQKLQKRSEQLGIQDSVIYGDYVTNDTLKQVMQQAQVMLSTSSTEGFGMSLVEGAAQGLPVVAYEVNYGVTEIVEAGVNGYVVKRGNFKDAADRIIQLLEDDEKLQEFSDGAYERAKRFSAAEMIKPWKTFMDDVALKQVRPLI
jgi:poly(glycerol-phosphate) alpha-glucosyltransferase